MAVLEPENNDDFVNKNDYVPPTMQSLVAQLPIEKQFALRSLLMQCDKIVQVGEKPKGEPYSGYVRVPENKLQEYKNIMEGIITNLFMKNNVLEGMIKKSL